MAWLGMGKGGRDESPAGKKKNMGRARVCVCAREGMSVSQLYCTVLYVA